MFPSYLGGPLLLTGDGNYSSSVVRQGQFSAFVRPYKTFLTNAQIPLMVGEWGWPAGRTGEVAWMADKKATWADAGTVIEMAWNYDVGTNTSVNPWAARPGGVWRPSVVEWMRQ